MLVMDFFAESPDAMPSFIAKNWNETVVQPPSIDRKMK
jgi:hypothetical protein